MAQALISEDMVRLNAALGKINGLYDRWAQGLGINYCTMQVLLAMRLDPEAGQKQISENFQLPKQSVNNTITALRKKGYLTLAQDTADKRAKKITLTEKGEKYSEEMLGPILKLDRNVIRRLGEAALQRLVDDLGAYGEALEQEINAQNK